MKCCGSQTIFTVPNAERTQTREREVAADFNALLIGAAFKPLAATLGFYGELVVATTSRAIARQERGGLTDRLEGALDSSGAAAAVMPR